MAERAKNANSYHAYKKGSATAEYRQLVDEAAEIAKQQKSSTDPMYHKKIDHLLDRYARKLAQNMNKGFEIDSRVPSILITGGGNFPVRKKEQQNQARDNNMKEWQEIKGILEKMKSVGMGGISADDKDAKDKLQTKLETLESLQKTMKTANAYFREHKTLEGCPVLSKEQIRSLSEDMKTRFYGREATKVFESYALQNNNAEINRLKTRIESLKNLEETVFVDWEFEGGNIKVNKEDNRLQVFFDEKPDADKRNELKSNGFRWAPSVGAWQRQLNTNAFRAANNIQCIKPLTGETPLNLQIQVNKIAEPQEHSAENKKTITVNNAEPQQYKTKTEKPLTIENEKKSQAPTPKQPKEDRQQKIEKGLENLFNSDKYQAYLKVLSKFHHYSFNNSLLIALQKPDATLVKGYQSWKNEFNRQVVKGQKGMIILSPMIVSKDEVKPVFNQATGEIALDPTGKPVMRQYNKGEVIGFKTATVFDISQTDGEPIKGLELFDIDELTGKVQNFENILQGIKDISPIPIEFRKLEGEAKGYYSPLEKQIVINEGMSDAQTLKTVVHELAHAKLHDIDHKNMSKEDQERYGTRNSQEVEAESVAFVVCNNMGLDTSDYSFKYVASWSSGKEMPELKDRMNTIRSCSHEIISQLETVLSKEKNKEKPSLLSALKENQEAIKNDIAKTQKEIHPSKEQEDR